MITLTWIVEDTASAPLKQEHGYAVWIESPDGIVLFDTGGSGEVLLHNMDVLGLDPAKIDAVVISHAHDDHTGGLAQLMTKVRPGIPLYAQETLFRARYSNKQHDMRYRGSPVTQQAVADVFDLRLSKEPREVLPGIWMTGDVQPRPYPEGRSTAHFIQQDDAYIPDPYEDDLSMVIEVLEGKFVLCGCCHAGLLNTLGTVERHWAQPLIGVAGGTHLNSASADTLALTVKQLRQAAKDLRYVWLGHCSGDRFMRAAEQTFGEIYRHCKAGDSLQLGA